MRCCLSFCNYFQLVVHWCVCAPCAQTDYCNSIFSQRTTSVVQILLVTIIQRFFCQRFTVHSETIDTLLNIPSAYQRSRSTQAVMVKVMSDINTAADAGEEWRQLLDQSAPEYSNNSRSSLPALPFSQPLVSAILAFVNERTLTSSGRCRPLLLLGYDSSGQFGCLSTTRHSVVPPEQWHCHGWITVMFYPPVGTLSRLQMPMNALAQCNIESFSFQQQTSLAVGLWTRWVQSNFQGVKESRTGLHCTNRSDIRFSSMLELHWHDWP